MANTMLMIFYSMILLCMNCAWNDCQMLHM